MDSRPLFPQPVAHRGLHNRVAGIIENSASAFEAAIQRGYAIECDLQLTRDDVPVVFHDDDLDRLTTITGPVRDAHSETLCNLPLVGSAEHERPQRFADLLSQIAGRTQLLIELKRQRDSRATEALARAAARIAGAYEGDLTFESFDPELIILVREFGFAGARGIVTYDYDDPDADMDLSEEQRSALRDLAHASDTRFDFISCDHKAVAMPSVRYWREQGLPVTAWTIRSESEAAAAAPHVDQIVFEGYDPV
jgi:glycerophosphoryl diester phosphodiesterase